MIKSNKYFNESQSPGPGCVLMTDAIFPERNGLMVEFQTLAESQISFQIEVQSIIDEHKMLFFSFSNSLTFVCLEKYRLLYNEMGRLTKSADIMIMKAVFPKQDSKVRKLKAKLNLGLWFLLKCTKYLCGVVSIYHYHYIKLRFGHSHQ